LFFYEQPAKKDLEENISFFRWLIHRLYTVTDLKRINVALLSSSLPVYFTSLPNIGLRGVAIEGAGGAAAAPGPRSSGGALSEEKKQIKKLFVSRTFL